MMSESKLEKIATDLVLTVFTHEYLVENGACRARGFVDDDTYQFFIGVKGEQDLPGRKATLKDWVVYAVVWLDANTGEILQTVGRDEGNG